MPRPSYELIDSDPRGNKDLCTARMHGMPCAFIATKQQDGERKHRKDRFLRSCPDLLMLARTHPWTGASPMLAGSQQTRAAVDNYTVRPILRENHPLVPGTLSRANAYKNWLSSPTRGLWRRCIITTFCGVRSRDFQPYFATIHHVGAGGRNG